MYVGTVAPRKIWSPTGYDVGTEIEEFLLILDQAETLCSFNGVKFDIPFIVQQFGVPACRYEPWIIKLFDYFEICRLVFASSCSLNNILLTNGYEVKTSSGLQAVTWAKVSCYRSLCMTLFWRCLTTICLYFHCVLTFSVARWNPTDPAEMFTGVQLEGSDGVLLGRHGANVSSVNEQ